MGDWSNNLEYEHREYYGHFYDTDEDVHEEETDDEMTNEEMLNKVLQNFFPRALFIREINEASHTKKIIFSDEWLKMPYRGGK